MNIAYLLLTHANASQTRMLVRSLAGPGARFYVHVDKAADFRRFSSALSDTDDVTIIPKRLNVKRCGFRMVEASLALLNFAVTNRTHDYYVLLSESHYPIAPNATIRERLETGNFEYIDATEMPSDNICAPLSRLEYFYIPSKARSSKVTASINYYLRSLPKRNLAKGLQGLSPYAGSQWWAISSACAKYVLDFVDQNKTFYRFFRFTETPDEIFFQTIIANSHFAGRIRPSLTYVDWSRKGPPFPSTLDSSDIEILSRSRKLFARKFDLSIDENILTNIEARLRS